MQTRLITILASLTLAACGNTPATDDSGTNPDTAPIDAAVDTGTPDSGTPDSGTPDASSNDGSPADGGSVPSIVARFDGSMYQFPESVTLHASDAFVSFINGHVMRVTASGTSTDFGNVPITYTAMNPDAYALGVASDPAGNIYVAMVKSSATSAYPAGIYRIPAAGGTGTLLASDPMMYLPNDLDIDAAGNLYITHDGTIFKATLAGATATVTAWKTDPLLQSSAVQPGPCGMRTSPFPIGANGIVVESDRVVVGNEETGALIQIPIDSSGHAGAASVIAMNSSLCGIDGLARDADGTYVAAVHNSTVVRISANGATVTPLAMGAPLFGAAGIEVGPFGTGRSIVISNPDFEHGLDGTPADAMPNLTALAE